MDLNLGIPIMIQPNTFWRIVVCGFIATFVMTMTSFLLSGIGLPVIDIGYLLQQTFNHIHDHDPYSIVWGNVAYYLFGIILALIWVIFLDEKIPGHWFIKGIAYGFIISMVAGLVVSPLVSSAVGEPFGIFYTDTWFPILTLLSGLVMHLSYGIVLTLSLNQAGVSLPRKK